MLPRNEASRFPFSSSEGCRFGGIRVITANPALGHASDVLVQQGNRKLGYFGYIEGIRRVSSAMPRVSRSDAISGLSASV